MTRGADEHFDPALKPLWRRKRWWFAGMLLVAAVVATLYVLSSLDEVSRQKAAIRARGEPVTLAELSAYYAAPPADQDVTRLWLTAVRSLDMAAAAPVAKQLPFLGNAVDPPPVGQAWPEIERSRNFLNGAATAMQQLHEAASLGGQARYPVDFQNGIMMRLDRMQWLRTAARCLSMEAHVRAHSGDMHGAAESIRTGLILSESLKHEPLLVSQLVRIAMHNMMVGLLKRIDPATFPAADLERLQATLAEIDFDDGLRRALAGERALGLSAFDDPASVGLPGPMNYIVWIQRGPDELTYLNVMAEFVAASELPWGECVEQTNFCARAFRQRVRRWNVLTNLLTPGVESFVYPAVRAETLNRLATVDVAIARYRQHHGHPPADLAALAPEFLDELPVDPISGDPFQYRATADRYVVYSDANLSRPNATGETFDPETGANANFVFRWPPLPEEVKEPAAPAEGSAEVSEEGVAGTPEDAPADAAGEPQSDGASSEHEPKR